MAELVDALVSGTSVGNNVQVRVLFWAPGKPQTAAAFSCCDYLLIINLQKDLCVSVSFSIKYNPGG